MRARELRKSTLAPSVTMHQIPKLFSRRNSEGCWDSETSLRTWPVMVLMLMWTPLATSKLPSAVTGRRAPAWTDGQASSAEQSSQFSVTHHLTGYHMHRKGEILKKRRNFHFMLMQKGNRINKSQHLWCHDTWPYSPSLPSLLCNSEAPRFSPWLHQAKPVLSARGGESAYHSIFKIY